MSKSYIWTEKAEARARELGIMDRTAGLPACFGYGDPGDIPGAIAKDWRKNGYIQEVAVDVN